MTEERTFQTIAKTFLKDATVTQAKMFGSPGLRVSGKVFAFSWKGRLVVKLSEQRVQQLVGSGGAQLFDPGHGSVSRRWPSSGRPGGLSTSTPTRGRGWAAGTSRGRPRS